MTEKSNQPDARRDTGPKGAVSDPGASAAQPAPAVPRTEEVAQAAAAIVEAFAATDTEAYFAGFAEEASFVFHPENRRLNSRAEYEAIWDGWLAEGWSVVSCLSSDPLVQTFPGGAVFSHTVDTTVRTAGGRETYRERESIVFRDLGGRLIAIHEHLSAVPAAAVHDQVPGGAGAADPTREGSAETSSVGPGDAANAEVIGR